jgi:hypothetical protein
LLASRMFDKMGVRPGYRLSEELLAELASSGKRHPRRTAIGPDRRQPKHLEHNRKPA